MLKSSPKVGGGDKVISFGNQELTEQEWSSDGSATGTETSAPSAEAGVLQDRAPSCLATFPTGTLVHL